MTTGFGGGASAIAAPAPPKSVGRFDGKLLPRGSRISSGPAA